MESVGHLRLAFNFPPQCRPSCSDYCQLSRGVDGVAPSLSEARLSDALAEELTG